MPDAIRLALEELKRVGLRGDVRGATTSVPDIVLRSWRRSIGSQVETDALCQRYRDVDNESVLCRVATPILDRWQDRLTDTGTTIFLSDRAGSIVARRTSDSSVRRRLDRVHAAEGFDYSEESVGTNGLGTSVAEGRAVMISGSQHYNDALARLACAAAPVRTPGGAMLGSISLAGPVEGASPLMLSLTTEIGQQIEERLRAESSPQDLALAMSFMRFSNSRRPTVIVDGESMLANTPGLPYVSVYSHVELWELLNAHGWNADGSASFGLSEGAVQITARRILEGPRPHYVVHFDSQSRPEPAAPGAAVRWSGPARTSSLALATPTATADGAGISAALERLVSRAGTTHGSISLAETPERIPGLVREILELVDPTGQHTMSPAALQAFLQWHWPGNLTELAATLTALVADRPGSVIERQHLPEQLRQAPPRRQMTLMESAERGAIIEALREARGNKREAAARLGIGRTTLYRRLRQLGLDDDESAL